MSASPLALLHWLACWPGSLVTVWVASFALTGLLLWGQRAAAGREDEQFSENTDKRHADVHRGLRP